MFLGKPRKLYWTSHAHSKMRQYHLSEARVKRILHTPKRVEEGIAEKTMAYMQPTGSKAHPHELWVMVEDVNDMRKVISAWRYPGVTKPRSEAAKQLLAAAYNEFMKREEAS